MGKITGFLEIQRKKHPSRPVEERIRAQARAFDPAVEGYVAYAVESTGKRLRPALALIALAAMFLAYLAFGRIRR